VRGGVEGVVVSLESVGKVQDCQVRECEEEDMARASSTNSARPHPRCGQGVENYAGCN